MNTLACISHLQVMLHRIAYYRGKNELFWTTELSSRVARFNPPPEIALQWAALQSVVAKFRGDETELDLAKQNISELIEQLKKSLTNY